MIAVLTAFQIRNPQCRPPEPSDVYAPVAGELTGTTISIFAPFLGKDDTSSPRRGTPMYVDVDEVYDAVSARLKGPS